MTLLKQKKIKIALICPSPTTGEDFPEAIKLSDLNDVLEDLEEPFTGSIKIITRSIKWFEKLTEIQ